MVAVGGAAVVAATLATCGGGDSAEMETEAAAGNHGSAVESVGKRPSKGREDQQAKQAKHEPRRRQEQPSADAAGGAGGAGHRQDAPESDPAANPDEPTGSDRDVANEPPTVATKPPPGSDARSGEEVEPTPAPPGSDQAG